MKNVLYDQKRGIKIKSIPTEVNRGGTPNKEPRDKQIIYAYIYIYKLHVHS